MFSRRVVKAGFGWRRSGRSDLFFFLERGLCGDDLMEVNTYPHLSVHEGDYETKDIPS